MAETRSKTSKKRDGSASFISNLSSAIKKSSKRQLEDNQVSLPSKKFKCPKVSNKISNDNFQGEVVQPISLGNTSESSNSTENVNQGFEDFSEEPLCFDGSENEAEICSERQLENDAPSKDTNDCGTNLEAKDVINSKSFQELNSSIVSECHTLNKEVKVSVRQTSENNSCEETEVIGNSNDINVPSACNASNEDSNPMDSNVKEPHPKAFIKPYNDLVNVLEEVKYINAVVKKIKEKMEKLIK